MKDLTVHTERLITLDEGATYEYLRHGLILLTGAVITGAVLSVNNMDALAIVLAFMLAIAAIGLMSVKTGVIINIETKQIQKYKSFFLLKFGKWHDLNKYITAELHFNLQNTKMTFNYNPLFAMQKPGDAKTYDLILMNDMEERFLFNPFLKIGLAKKAIEALDKVEGLTTVNLVDEWVKKQLLKRRLQ